MNLHPKDPQISVVIPTYNYAHFLPEAIESVLIQSVPAFEIIVADDGSTDNTTDLVAQYGKLVKYHRYNHQGVYAIRTRVLELVRGDWFVNLDADNRLAQNFIEKMLEAIRFNNCDKAFAFAYPDMQYFGGRSGTVKRPEFNKQLLKRGNYLDMNSAIRTSVAKQFGFDPSFNKGQGDYDFFITLVKNGYTGVRVPSACLCYRVHEESIAQKAGKKRRQREIIKRILRKHVDFFTVEEKKYAMAEANNRLLIALINSRSPISGPLDRLRDWFFFILGGWRHAEFYNQTKYCFFPKWYFLTEVPIPDIFYLFRDSPRRRYLVRGITENTGNTIDGGQLFGFDVLRTQGKHVDCNLFFSRPSQLLDHWRSWIDRRYAARTGIGRGDRHLVRSFVWQMKRAKVNIATTDNVGLPASVLKYKGKFFSPLIYVSIGLPERLENLEAISRRRAIKYRRQLSTVDCFVTYGYGEAKWLRQWLGNGVDVRFVPFGVDVGYFDPSFVAGESLREVDVLSVGADPQRDYSLLMKVVRTLPDIHFRIVTTRIHESFFADIPNNLDVIYDIPLETFRRELASARIVVLPVKQNTYTGATTTLLQAMAMCRPVVATRTEAISRGYGLENDSNCLLVEPDDEDGLTMAIRNLLNDSENADRIAKEAGSHVRRKLTWQHYVQRISDIIEEIENKADETIK